jgi:hypothetical protein
MFPLVSRTPCPQCNEEDDGGDANDDGPADNESTVGYTSPAAERAPDDMDVSIACAEAIPIQEISSFRITERKRRSAAIEVAIPQPKRPRLEIPVRARHQGEKNKLFFARTNALLKIERMLNAKKSPFEGGHNGLQAC